MTHPEQEGPYRVVRVDDPKASEPVFDVVGPTDIRHSATERYRDRDELDTDAWNLNAAYRAGAEAMRERCAEHLRKRTGAGSYHYLIADELSALPVQP